MCTRKLHIDIKEIDTEPSDTLHALKRDLERIEERIGAAFGENDPRPLLMLLNERDSIEMLIARETGKEKGGCIIKSGG